MIVTPKEIKETWCFGLPLTKEDGTIQSDADVQLFIDSAIVETQRKLGIFLQPTRVKSNPLRRKLVEGVDYDLEEPPYDYRPEQYRNFGFIQLRQHPIVSVERVALVLPNGQTIVEYPKEWIKVYPKVGQLQIVPMSGSPTVMQIASMGSAGFALMNNRWGSNIPQAIEVDYLAGLPSVPADIHNVVAKIASIDLLGIASDALLAGISSLSTSVDGMSESFTTSQSAEFSQYGSHIVQYQQEVGAFFGVNKTGEGQHAVSGGGGRTYYKGFTMTIL